MTTPILTIWTTPRGTIRQVVGGGHSSLTPVLACAAGVVEITARRLAGSGGAPPPWTALPGAAVLGCAWGLVWLWLLAGTVHACGRWLGGTATKASLRTALAWGSVPTGAALPLVLAPWLLLHWSEGETWVRLTATAVPLAVGALTVASFALRCHTVAEVQGFRSAWRALGNLLLAVAIIAAPLLPIFVGSYLFFSAGTR